MIRCLKGVIEKIFFCKGRKVFMGEMLTIKRSWIMKRLFQLVMIAAMSFVLAGNLFALTWDNHVSQAPNGKGDVLIFPYYDTEFGWQTKIQVINTSLTTAAVAKVVVRSASYSQEVLDFFIFLTPTDMWEGILSQECFSAETDWAGRCAVRVSHMKSVDNSTLISEFPLSFANDQNPFIYPLQQPGCDDTPHEGYVEVYLAAVFDGAVPGMNKETVYGWYVNGGTLARPETPFGAIPAIL